MGSYLCCTSCLLNPGARHPTGNSFVAVADYHNRISHFANENFITAALNSKKIIPPGHERISHL